jgi:hypothetical protein
MKMMAGSRFSEFMGKGATAFASPNTSLIVLAAALAVGSTYLRVVSDHPEVPSGAQLAATVSAPSDMTRKIVEKTGMPRFVAMRTALLAGFGAPTLEIMGKLDPAVVEIVAEVKKSSGQEFSLLPLSEDGSVFTPMVLEAKPMGFFDYDKETSLEILKEIGALALERGVHLECTSSYYGTPGCGTKLPEFAIVVAPAELELAEIAPDTAPATIGMCPADYGTRPPISEGSDHARSQLRQTDPRAEVRLGVSRFGGFFAAEGDW